jgi:molybdate transport system ATP-binding protein
MSLRASIRLVLGNLDLDADLTVDTGELLVLLGPNGAGKTTLLRALAGLVPLADGLVELDGEILDDPAKGVHVPAERRPVGVVFQDYLLFSNMSVLDNVAFGLRARGTPRAEARAEAAGWLERVGLDGYDGARPRALSGGQAQRVALARALATRPRLLLLDEPLSALDVSARAELRRALRAQLDSYEGTRLLVTHDPVEALTLADRLLVVEAGRVTQAGTPAEVSARPRSRYVAEVVGVNLLRGRSDGATVQLPGGAAVVTAEPSEGEVFALVHPRSVALHRERPGGTPRNVWPATADGLDLAGDRVRVRLSGVVPLVAEITLAAANELRLADGGPVFAAVKATDVVVYPT